MSHLSRCHVRLASHADPEALACWAPLGTDDPEALACWAPLGTETWCGVEHFASGTAIAALFTCMMDWSRTETGGNDYTVQASAVVIATGLAATISGVSAAALDYAGQSWSPPCCVSQTSWSSPCCFRAPPRSRPDWESQIPAVVRQRTTGKSDGAVWPDASWLDVGKLDAPMWPDAGKLVAPVSLDAGPMSGSRRAGVPDVAWADAGCPTRAGPALA